jgi:hypothetical protein
VSAAASKPRSVFGHQLRTEIDERGVTVRELARRIHRANGPKWKDAESVRRSIARWMTTNPSTENRRECAIALGLDPSHFGTADDEDEESELFATLTEALDALVRHAVRRERERVA